MAAHNKFPADTQLRDHQFAAVPAAVIDMTDEVTQSGERQSVGHPHLLDARGGIAAAVGYGERRGVGVGMGVGSLPAVDIIPVYCIREKVVIHKKRGYPRSRCVPHKDAPLPEVPVIADDGSG